MSEKVCLVFLCYMLSTPGETENLHSRIETLEQNQGWGDNYIYFTMYIDIAVAGSISKKLSIMFVLSAVNY